MRLKQNILPFKKYFLFPNLQLLKVLMKHFDFNCHICVYNPYLYLCLQLYINYVVL